MGGFGEKRDVLAHHCSIINCETKNTRAKQVLIGHELHSAWCPSTLGASRHYRFGFVVAVARATLWYANAGRGQSPVNGLIVEGVQTS